MADSENEAIQILELDESFDKNVSVKVLGTCAESERQTAVLMRYEYVTVPVWNATRTEAKQHE
jgi:hypothetical protein